MRAAVLHEQGASPIVGDFDEPGGERMQVLLAGCNPVDILRTTGAIGPVTVPMVVGREGVARLADGSRAYFLDAPTPFGSWAEWVPRDTDRLFALDDDVSDEMAVAMGIAGTAGWLATEKARIERGERVLVLGATGVVGQIATQAARIMGAGTVVAAGRNTDGLARISDWGADATVVIGGEDEQDALRAHAGDGYDVVIDAVFGPALVAAMAAAAPGARIVTVGGRSSPVAEVPAYALFGKTLIGHANALTPAAEQQVAFDALLGHARAGRIMFEIVRYALADAAGAWQAQLDGSFQKIVIAP